MKKLVSLLLCIIMVLGIIPVIGITASAAAEPSLKKDTDGAYLISSVEDWENFTDFTRAGSGAVLTCDGMTFRLTTDLDFTNYNGRLASTKHYLMIGEYYSNGANARYFSGTFDGQGHTISGLDFSLGRGSGLFAAVSGATIRNVRVEDCSFALSSISGTQYNGGLVALVRGKAGNEETVIENCYVADSVSVKGMRVGGIVGQLNTDGTYNNCKLTIRDCYSAATLENYDHSNLICLGGIIGIASAGSYKAAITIENCTAVGTIKASNMVSGKAACIGGIAGVLGSNMPVAEGETQGATSVIKNCYADTAIIGTGTLGTVDYTGIGGICGGAAMASGTTPVSIENCYTTANISAGTNYARIGAVIGDHSKGANTVVTVDCDYLDKGLSAVAAGVNDKCDVTNATVTTAVLPTLPSVSGTLVLNETNVGIRFYVGADAENVSYELNGEAALTDANNAITDNVDVKDMDKLSCLTVVAKVGDTEYRKPIFYGVATYAELQTEDATAKAVAEALMTYGKYARAYFEKTEGLSDVAAENKNPTTPAKADPDGIAYGGSSIIIDSAITLRHYYTLEEGKNIEDFALTVEGNALTWGRNEVLDLYYVDFKVGAIDLGKQFDVKLGDTVILRHSVMDYCDKVADKSENKSLVNLVNALYNYRWAANDYFLDHQA